MPFVTYYYYLGNDNFYSQLSGSEYDQMHSAWESVFSPWPQIWPKRHRNMFYLGVRSLNMSVLENI